MTSKFDLTKPYRTRGGQTAAAIKAPDGTLHGYVYDGDLSFNHWWNERGRFMGTMIETGLDLVNVPETRAMRVWTNVVEYDGKSLWAYNYLSREDADRNGDMDGAGKRIACIARELVFTVGEGLGE